MKTNEFYEMHASNRVYFYTVDLVGRLFLEETHPKNIATSLKSTKFLDFFFKQMRRNDTYEHGEYPYYSPCGKEHNYIRPADTGIVFHEFLNGSELVFGGSLREPFSGDDLAYSERTGRFYHRLSDGGKAKLQNGTEYGLIKSSVAGQIADQIEFGEEGDMYYNNNMGAESKIRLLPREQESERWGLPPT